MADAWFFDETDRLYFVYRAKKWDETPIRSLNDTEIASVAAVAYDADSNSIAISQQPVWNAEHDGFLGYIGGGNLTDKSRVTIKLTATLVGGAPAQWSRWASPQRVDVNIEKNVEQTGARLVS